MKKELLALILLLCLVLVSALSLHHISSLTERILTHLDQTEAALESEHWGEAAVGWQKAYELWEESCVYRDVFLRHQDSDSVLGDFMALKGLILSLDSEAASAACELLRQRLKGIASMERPSLGSVF